jgi:hypothetical protein
MAWKLLRQVEGVGLSGSEFGLERTESSETLPTRFSIITTGRLEDPFQEERCLFLNSSSQLNASLLEIPNASRPSRRYHCRAGPHINRFPTFHANHPSHALLFQAAPYAATVSSHKTQSSPLSMASRLEFSQKIFDTPHFAPLHNCDYDKLSQAA